MINPESLDLSTLPWLPLDERTAFPKQPAIYFAIDSQGNIQYIGRSVNPKIRWYSHHKYDELQAIGNIRIAYLFMDVDLLPSVESALIDWFDPPLNTVGKSNQNTDSKIFVNLKNLRQANSLSQCELSELTNIPIQSIQKIEQNRAKVIQLNVLDALCDALRCEVSDLLIRVANR